MGKQHDRVARTKSAPAGIGVNEQQWKFIRASALLHIFLKIRLTDADVADLARAYEASDKTLNAMCKALQPVGNRASKYMLMHIKRTKSVSILGVERCVLYSWKTDNGRAAKLGSRQTS
jgi:hypothetical protein